MHAKIIKSFESFYKENDTKEGPQLHFRSVPIDYAYPEKKLPKEVLSVEGILKNDWISKHFSLIPSVIIFCVPFSVDWPAQDWAKREAVAQDRYYKLKSVVGPRDIKIIIFMVRIGSGIMDKDILDERVSSFKRHAQTDSKSFVFVTPHEVSQTDNNSVMKRILKSIREFSHSYYTANIKKFKAIEKGISEKYKGVLECILLARFNFKIAFLNEFQNQPTYSLRYYRQAYHALAASIETIDEELYDQVKTVAEISHFKLCNILFSSGSMEEAFQQFKTHMSVFVKLYSAHPWRHHAWVSDQYIVFAQLLDAFGIKEESHPSADRAFYFHNAARYTQKREFSFDKIKRDVIERIAINSSLSSFGIEDVQVEKKTTFRGMHIVTPKFLGSSPQLLDPLIGQFHISHEESERLYAEYLQEQEIKVDHHLMILEFLKQSLERLNPTYTRRRGILLALIAEENIRDNDYELAMTHLLWASTLLSLEGWTYPAISVLGLVLKCAAILGRPSEYIKAALIIYSNGASAIYSRPELEELHLNLMALFMKTLCPSESVSCEDNFVNNSFLVCQKSSFITTSFTPIISRSEYGSRSHLPLKSLPVGYVIHINRENPMFIIKTTFDKPSVELGQTLTVTIAITSNFIDILSFDEITFHFIEDSVIKRVCVDSGDPARLQLKPGIPARFSFELEVTEEEFGRFVGAESAFCLDRGALSWYMRKNEFNNDEFKEREKGLSFVISAYPETVQRVRKMPGKPCSAKDSYLFCPYEPPDFVMINKPTSLLSIISPTMPVSILEGLLHRVDVVCKVGRYDLTNGKIYMSSDKVMASSEGSGDDALFWSPDMRQIIQLNEQRKNDIHQDISFYPFVLNNSQQPASPLQLTCSLPAGSIFTIPIFLRVKRCDKPVINVKLTVDFVPLGVLKSSMIKELHIQIQPLRPMMVDFTVSAMDHRDQYQLNSLTILPNSRNILTAHVRCKNALPGSASITIDGSTMKTFTGIKLDDNGLVEFLSPACCNDCRFELKPNEDYVTSVPFRYQATDKAGKLQTAVAPGVLELRWRVTGLDPLNPPCADFINDGKQFFKCGLFGAACSAYDWLLYGCDLNDVMLGADRGTIIADAVSVTLTSISRFPVPHMQVRTTISPF